MLRRLTILIILFFSGNPCFAQSQNIQTDRAGNTLSPHPVVLKWAQAELGFTKQTFTYSKPWNETYVYHPSLLVKYGLFKNIELRVISELASLQSKAVNGNDSKTGLTNLQAGFKFKLFDEKGIRPHIALVSHYRFNHLQTLYKDTIDGANFRLAMEHTLSEAFFLQYNFGMSWKRFSSGRAPAYEYSLSPKIWLGQKWIAFAEVYGIIWKKYGPVHSIDAGLGFYIKNNIKLDINAGINLGKREPAHFFGIGGSYRFYCGKK